ncbi:MAG: sulfatase [Planctomycetaceae bacterium]|nr:sulfatase [Planctomycetaceae bacterium]
MPIALISRILVACGVMFLATIASAAEAKPARPNVLILMADNWAWPHASRYGDPVVKTPTFDRLAREGMLFHRAYCSVPSCAPARAVFLTGQAAHRLEDAANLHGRFPAKFTVFPDLLEKAGYRVGHSGKGWGPGKVPESGRSRNPGGDTFESLDEFLTKSATDQPFCFWLSSRDPHVPWTEGRDFMSGIDRTKIVVPPHLPDRSEVREDIAGYYCEVQNFDRDCDRALKLLESRQLLDNTLVIMTGDNGWQMPRGLAHMYDLSTHVPLVVRLPRLIRAGSDCDGFVNFEDFAPTLLELAGLKPSSNMTGRSFANILRGGPVEGRDATFIERERHAHVRAGAAAYPCRSIRTKDFLYIENLRPDRWPAGDPELVFSVGPYGDVDGSLTKTLLTARPTPPELQRFFALTFAKRPPEELYDLRTDPGEIDNRATEPSYAMIKRQLAERLREWRVATADPRVTQDDDRWDKYPYYGGPARRDPELKK